MRGGKALPNPQPHDRIEAGDTILVVGDREQVDRVRPMLTGSG
jgi:K+/H+ antiporter YhaU regulatory subunit KhtT